MQFHMSLEFLFYWFFVSNLTQPTSLPRLTPSLPQLITENIDKLI